LAHNDTTYTPSLVYDLDPKTASLLSSEAYVAGLRASDDIEYTTDTSIYAAAFPLLWQQQRFDFFNYSLS
jgi:hypothetical protein